MSDIIFSIYSDLIPILEALKHPLVLIHLIGFSLGVGGATISDIMFFRFLKDFRISKSEDAILKILSQVIWFGLLLLVVSGIGLYLPEAAALNESSKFLLKAVVVGIILVNGLSLNFIIAPHLVKISFNDTHTKTNQVGHLRKFAFASGAISFVSWYTAFFLGTISSAPFSFLQLFGIYASIVCIAVVVSLCIERWYCTQSISTNTR